MDHYLDLQLRSDPEIAPHQLMNALFTRLHKVLVTLKRDDVGVSFPEHDEAKPALGSRMRLHGAAEALHQMMGNAWLKGVADHVLVSEIKAVPPGVSHRQVRRVQAQSSPERLRRRAMRRHGLSSEEATGRIPDEVQQRVKLPFVTIGSQSTRQPAFPLFISHGPIGHAPIQGHFSSYALSLGGTVPWF